MSKVNLGVPPTPGGLAGGAVGIDLLEDDTMMIRHFLVQDQHFIICDSDDIFIHIYFQKLHWISKEWKRNAI